MCSALAGVGILFVPFCLARGEVWCATSEKPSAKLTAGYVRAVLLGVTINHEVQTSTSQFWAADPAEKISWLLTLLLAACGRMRCFETLQHNLRRLLGGPAPFSAQP